MTARCPCGRPLPWYAGRMRIYCDRCQEERHQEANKRAVRRYQQRASNRARKNEWRRDYYRRTGK